MGYFETKKLPLTAGVEQVSLNLVSPLWSALTNLLQCCATGLTAEGKVPKTLVEEMVPLLDDRSVRCVSVA